MKKDSFQGRFVRKAKVQKSWASGNVLLSLLGILHLLNKKRLEKKSKELIKAKKGKKKKCRSETWTNSLWDSKTAKKMGRMFIALRSECGLNKDEEDAHNGGRNGL